LLLAALVLMASACEVRTRVQVTVEEDGSGVVEVAVGLDREALAQVPDLDGNGTSDVTDLVALVRTEDLEAAGWRVSEPDAAGSDMTWIRVSKPFGTPAEANAVLAEVSGPSGPLRDMRLSRSTGFASTKLSFTGTADLSGGLEAFGDSGLAQALDGEPLGEDAAQIEQRLGEPLTDAFHLDVVVDLRGEESHWSPRLGSPAERLSASSSVRDWPVLLLTVFAVLCIVAAVAAAVWMLLIAPRARGEGAHVPASRAPGDGEGERHGDEGEGDLEIPPGWRHPPPVPPESGPDIPGWHHPPPVPPPSEEVPEVPDETAPVPSDPDEVPGWRHPPPVS
jgi:hypothetical protein